VAAEWRRGAVTDSSLADCIARFAQSEVALELDALLAHHGRYGVLAMGDLLRSRAAALRKET